MFGLNLFRFNHKLCVCVCVCSCLCIKTAVGLEHRNCVEMYMFLLSRDYIYVSDFSFFFVNESVLLPDTVLKVMTYAFFIILHAFYGYIL